MYVCRLRDSAWDTESLVLDTIKFTHSAAEMIVYTVVRFPVSTYCSLQGQPIPLLVKCYKVLLYIVIYLHVASTRVPSFVPESRTSPCPMETMALQILKFKRGCKLTSVAYHSVCTGFYCNNCQHFKIAEFHVIIQMSSYSLQSGKAGNSRSFLQIKKWLELRGATDFFRHFPPFDLLH